MSSYEKEFSAGTLEDSKAIRQFVEQSALSLGASDEETGEIVLAVNEAAANIFTHGYKKEPGYIRIGLRVKSGVIVITIYDISSSFDPTEVPQPDITVPLHLRPYGGMGVHMMRKFTDEMTYSSSPSGENELTLIKRLS